MQRTAQNAQRAMLPPALVSALFCRFALHSGLTSGHMGSFSLLPISCTRRDTAIAFIQPSFVNRDGLVAAYYQGVSVGGASFQVGDRVSWTLPSPGFGWLVSVMHEGESPSSGEAAALVWKWDFTASLTGGNGDSINSALVQWSQQHDTVTPLKLPATMEQLSAAADGTGLSFSTAKVCRVWASVLQQ